MLNSITLHLFISIALDSVVTRLKSIVRYIEYEHAGSRLWMESLIVPPSWSSATFASYSTYSFSE